MPPRAPQNAPDKTDNPWLTTKYRQLFLTAKGKARQHPKRTFFIVLIPIVLFAIPWLGQNYARSFVPIYIGFFLGTACTIFVWWLKTFFHSHQTPPAVALIVILFCIFVTFDAGFAEAHYTASTVEAGDDTSESSTIEQEEEPPEPVKEIPEVELDEDFLMVCSNIGSDREVAKQAARNFAEKYRDGNLPYPREPVEKLDPGSFGDRVGKANKHHVVVGVDAAPEDQLNAAKNEDWERKVADEVSAEPNNLIPRSDAVLKSLELGDYDADEKKVLYHDAIRCCWKALQVWNSEGPGPYTDGWNRIYEAYNQMGADLQIKEKDRERAAWLAKIFEEILEEEKKKASIFSNSK